MALGYTYHVFLLDLKTERRFDMGRAGFYGASEPLVMFSADSRRVFSYGYRRTLWDIEGRKQVADLAPTTASSGRRSAQTAGSCSPRAAILRRAPPARSSGIATRANGIGEWGTKAFAWCFLGR